MTLEEKRAQRRAISIKHRLANKEAVARRDREWRAKNRDRKRAQDAAYKAAKADRLKQQSHEYYAKHSTKIRTNRSMHHATRKTDSTYRTKMLEVAADWRAANPDKMATHHADRFFKFQRSTPHWADLAAIRVIYEKRDELSERFGIQLQVDHVIPINSPTVCGLHVPANLQLLEKSLNSAKGNRFDSDW